MADTHQLCTRLIAALEDLASQEATSLAHGEWDTLVSLRKRAEPLVELLASQDPEEIDSSLRARIGAWREGRLAAERELSVRIGTVRERLEELDASRRRLARVIPAYVPRPEVESRHLAGVG
ncbi:MAG: hypothetical protein HZC55_10340 [Verrucomicrobia bacterium]|nr:hypothetical protein [Verrucomicrobiota bacterium]